METKIEVKTIEEFESLMEEDNINISTIIVNAILDNLYSTKRFVYILTVYVEENGEIYDITLDRKYFIETLQNHLSIQEKNEAFETCSNILKAIDYLEQKN